MTGTVTVTVHRRKSHPIYRKHFRVSKKFLVDTNNVAVGVGDEVLITECRPLSKRKRFKVSEVLKQAPRVGEIGEEAGLAEVMRPSVATSSVPSDSSVASRSASSHSASSGPTAGPSAVPSPL